MTESFCSQLEKDIGAKHLNNMSYNYDQQARGCNKMADIDPWRSDATIEDWKKYFFSTSDNRQPERKEPELAPHYQKAVTFQNYSILNTASVEPKKSYGAHTKFTSTSDGGFRPIVKGKRRRSIFTIEQVAALEQVFFMKPYVTRDERRALEQQLHISEKAIQKWFQNRRMKEKKLKAEQDFDPSSDISETSTENTQGYSLAYVESQLLKTDRFGYVTLDDRAFSELFTAIDGCIPRDSNIQSFNKINESKENLTSSVSKSVCIDLYEPISPPNLVDDVSENALAQNLASFQAVDPNIALENLTYIYMNRDFNVS